MKINRWIATVLVLSMMLTSALGMRVFATEGVLASGTDANNLAWVLTQSGTLTISGTGQMEDYGWNNAPWYNYRSAITSVIIGEGVTNIVRYAFRNCSNLESVSIPNSVTSIDFNSFAYCSSLTRVEIPNSVTCIESDVFSDCTSLESVTIGTGLVSIGQSAFYCCTSLTGIWVDANNPYYSNDDFGVLFNEDKSELIFAPGAISGAYSIPGSVISIGNDAFSDCESLESVTIADSVITVGSYAFYDCVSLESVTIGNSVTSIGNDAFEYCESLESIIIPDSVASIGEYAFYGCESLSEIYFEGNAPDFGYDVFGDVYATAYYPAYNATWTEDVMLDCSESITWVSMDSCVHSWVAATCTTPKTCALCGATEGEELGHSYENAACARCGRAEPVAGTLTGYCGDDVIWMLTPNGLLTIYGTGDMWRFSYASPPWPCDQVIEVIVESGVTGISDYAFYDCIAMTGIRIDDTVTGIGKYAFYGCNALESIVLPDSVTELGENAISWCDKLENIVLSAGLTHIGEYALSANNSLKNIEIPDGVTCICDNAFAGCSSLTGVTIGEHVATVGNYAFSNCTDLAAIYFEGDAPSINTDAFEDVTATAYYPADNATWTEAVMQNYGGSITWVSLGSGGGQLQTSVKLTHISLKPAADALGFKAAAQNLPEGAELGISLWVSEDNVITRSVAKENIALRLQNIMAEGGGETVIYAKAIIVDRTGEVIAESSVVQTSMRETLEAVNNNWNSFNGLQKTAVKALVEKYYTKLSAWAIENILNEGVVS